MILVGNAQTPDSRAQRPAARAARVRATRKKRHVRPYISLTSSPPLRKRLVPSHLGLLIRPATSLVSYSGQSRWDLGALGALTNSPTRYSGTGIQREYLGQGRLKRTPPSPFSHFLTGELVVFGGSGDKRRVLKGSKWHCPGP